MWLCVTEVRKVLGSDKEFNTMVNLHQIDKVFVNNDGEVVIEHDGDEIRVRESLGEVQAALAKCEDVLG